MHLASEKCRTRVAGAASRLTGKIGLPLTALSGVLGGFSLIAIKNAVVGFTDMGEAIKNGATRAGMSVQEYQRMRYVAEQSGTSIDAMEGSLSKLNRQMGEAASGKNRVLAQLMGKLRITLRDTNGEVRRGIDVLPKIADAFKRNENPAIRARMGMALFGKSYAEILPLLIEGSGGIEDNLRRFDKIKGVLGNTEIDAAKALGDSFKDLDLVMKGFQGTIAKELVPVINPLVDGMVAWWVANKKLVGVEVGKGAKDLAAWIRSIDFKKVITGVEDMMRSLGRWVDAVGGAQNALIALVVVMNAQTLMALASLVGAIGRAGIAFLALAARAYIAANASLLAMARIAVIAIATAGPIGAIGAAFTWVAALATGAGGIISGALGMVSMAIRGIGAALMANPLGIILGLATAAYLIYQHWDSLKKWFADLFDWMGKKFGTLIKWAGDLARKVGEFFSVGSPTESPATIAEPARPPVAGSSLTSPRVAGVRFLPDAVAATATARFPAAGLAPLPARTIGADRPSLVAPVAQVKASGEIQVNFKDAPPGMRVEQSKSSGDVPVNTTVGYRAYAMGMP